MVSEYAQTAYCKLLFGVEINNSFAATRVSSASLNITLLLADRDLIFDLRTAFFPALSTDITVFEVEYPIPGLTTTTSVSFPFAITGLNFAPLPSPDAVIFGIEKYSDPLD